MPVGTGYHLSLGDVAMTDTITDDRLAITYVLMPMRVL
jgi:hypothetical protein